MVSPKRGETPATDYVSARSRTASIETAQTGNRVISMAPLSDDRAIGVSNSTKRLFKDRRIYVNKRTGMPVRPPTSFGLFKHALRRSIKSDKVSFSDFNKLASEKWSQMSDADKGLYVQRAKDLADQYKKIEVRFLRKKVRQLQSQFKVIRQASTGYRRR